jgi:Myb-like DNA-binding protein REB1
MFPLPNYMTYTAFFPGPQPSMSLFPTPNNLPFPDLAFGSNEDVLRALQDLDISKIAGVLKTLTDAADAANIPTPLTGIPSTSTLPSLAAASSASTISSKLASPSSDLPSHPDHAHLLASKWMGPTKLAELVASEGLLHPLLLQDTWLTYFQASFTRRGNFRP